jgi:hypothetical protein
MAIGSMRRHGHSTNRHAAAWPGLAGRAGSGRSGEASSRDACAGCGETDPAKLNHHYRLPAWLAGRDGQARVMILCDACQADDEQVRQPRLRPWSIALWIIIALLLFAFFELV